MTQTLEQPICKVSSDGTKHWFKNGKLHRINGPAIEFSNGEKRWYLHGKKVTQQDVIKPSPLIMFMII